MAGSGVLRVGVVPVLWGWLAHRGKCRHLPPNVGKRKIVLLVALGKFASLLRCLICQVFAVFSGFAGCR